MGTAAWDHAVVGAAEGPRRAVVGQERRAAVLGRGVVRLYMVLRSDGILLGGTFGRGDYTVDVGGHPG